MAPAPASAARAPAAGSQDSADREKEFFTTWLRLMERQKDATDLTQALQSLLAQDGDTAVKLQDARHQANMLSANNKTTMELVALLNDFFFRDIVPALKRAKQVDAAVSANQQAQDPLDRYLEHGDEGAAMPQAFVDDMSGWGAAEGRKREQNNGERGKKKKKKRKERAEEEHDEDEDAGISMDMLQDLLIANSLKLTARQAPDYSARMQGRVVQQRAAAMQNAGANQTAAGARTNAPSFVTASPRVMRGKGTETANKRGRKLPPPIVTDLPPRPVSAGSTTHTPSRNPMEAANKKDRIGKRTAASLIAEQVLRVRTYGSAREYLIRWQGVQAPLWISRRKAPPQAKQLIDLYAAELRTRGGASPNQGAVEQTRRIGPKARKKFSRDGSSLRQGQQTVTEGGAGTQQVEFYTVDHIVNHRLFYSKRQYLVRWENYDESEDTWENADKLRADVPDIVDAYEEHLQRGVVQAEAFKSAMSELIRDRTLGPKSAAKKRSIGRASAEEDKGKNNTQLPVGRDQVDGEHPNEKRRRIVTNTEGKSNGADGGNTSEDDYQFDLEEAELEEFSDEEFADKLNN
ncbi:hypothetical protein PHYPSEUDO_006713 [Phytophthora pseudosyringae]|uniref:Chromo domain-containing protein n=1 Tax=Phytophthora pseudosyringae TaxID=221518 RepID=A0A8T1VKY9_9STRA|nr:hypothetical protein PHYPSEUDO_006713 [Phytophthora pseudosyringae]